MVHEQYHSLVNKPDKCNDDECFKEVDERVFTFKHKVSYLLEDGETEQRPWSKKSSKIDHSGQFQEVQAELSPNKQPQQRRLNWLRYRQK